MKIPENVLRVLSVCEVDGTAVRITSGQLDRKLYLGVNAVLAELGGKWNRKTRAHLFPADPTDTLDAVINAGEVTTARELGYFPTPAPLVRRMVALARVGPGMDALEPSAGEGAIAVELARAGAMVTCFEIDPARMPALERALARHASVRHRADFLQVDAAPWADRVVMNPPFARQADIDHVRHAYAMLKPGGRLVAVMSAGVAFRENRKAVEFRALVAAAGGTIEALPDGTFAEAGTHVRTVLVTMDRP